ncbi:carboxymuconolactone decarboxylase family protein [Flagellimonas allohymeniacidonis]|uniref:Carboxymuconolactone decarboxylase family protein n=1 Tax=Flagellimonas allohymeniacidonis TaxID=2517819 RepID=A0A4Q8QMM6_9FLAO|nr:carboxymuconolactone decarboxylase family protein [Allomuricauda hymeniacidonis]TAI49566.1 carboxymuconolactone decarboxylase family protein [Allomuricauda hymeniacidonis]
MEPRIKALEKPPGLWATLIYGILRKQYGKVLMPAKVIYSRYPKIAFLVKKIYSTERSFKHTSEEQRSDIQKLVASLNGCAFCQDLIAKNEKNKINRTQASNKEYSFGDTTSLSFDKERAIYQYVTEMTQHITVSDKTYTTLKTHCSDEEIIEITFTASSENFLNRLIKPLNIGSDQLCSLP